MTPTSTTQQIRPSSYVPPEELQDSIVRHVERTVKRYPENVAVADGEAALTYAQLNAAANCIAKAILDSDAGAAQDPVALLLGHDRWAILAMLGILKAGRPYVALHASNPPERLRTLLEDSGSRLLISSAHFEPLIHEVRGILPALGVLNIEDIDLESAAPDPGIYVPGEAPYTINHTSGSTGDPKGMIMSHGNIAFCSLREVRDWDVDEHDRTSLVYSLSFGAAYACIMNAFLRGGAVCLFDFAAHGPEAALDWVQSAGVTILRLTPSMWRAMFKRAPADLVLPSLRLISLGGEAARVSDAAIFKQHTAPHCELHNVFASSEAGVVALFMMNHDTLLEGERMPAGPIIPGHEVTIVEDDVRPVPEGEPGEIVVRSRHLHSGYWRRPDLTAERFVEDPRDPTLKTLHTGDLGRWRPDGMLEYIGRKDSMVKIRGYRVEIGEIESHLHASGLVGECAVALRELPNLPGSDQLVGYVAPHPGGTLDLDALRAYLASKLPEYSIPSVFVPLERLPISPHGKVDRQALPQVPQRANLTGEDLPANDVEKTLLGIWSSHLRLATISVRDNFFELGGDSLSVLSMIVDVEQRFGRTVPQAFFAHATVRALADLLQRPAEAHAVKPGFRLRERAATPAFEELKRKQGVGRRVRVMRREVHAYRRTHDIPNLFESLLALRFRHMTYPQVQALIHRLSEKDWLLASVYRGERAMFTRLLRATGRDPASASDLFPFSFRSNLLFDLLEGRDAFALPSSPLARDRRQRVWNVPADRLDDVFPVTGLEHLQTGLARGKGVILLSCHGTAMFQRVNEALATRLAHPAIETIAYLSPLRQSYAWGEGLARHMAPEEKGSLFAELAHHARLLLLQNHVIHIAPDAGHGAVGPQSTIVAAGRRYKMRPGFAELALNTGASLVPAFGRFDEHDRALMEIRPPFEAPRGTRAQQIDALVRQFGKFLHSIMSEYPEIFTWRKIRNHFKLPRAEAP